MSGQESDGLAGPVTNRLAEETSPYLLQHAHNPVDWYPWGPEAWERARAENKPVLVSIGYAACHWCHVMERESFEDEAIAQQQNDAVVSIKVDREERPDVDEIYMEAVQLLHGQGGWPLNVFCLPDGRPFFGGTYFPPTGRMGMNSWPQVLEAVSEAYRERGDQVVEQADRLLSHIGAQMGRAGADEGSDVPDVDGGDGGGGGGVDAVFRSGRTAGSGVRRSFRSRSFCCCCGGMGLGLRMGRWAILRWQRHRSRRCCRRCGRWRMVGCTTNWVADFIATPSMRSGWRRTSRRCCTTTRCWRRSTSMRGGGRGMRRFVGWRWRRWIIWWRRCRRRRAGFTRARTRTRKGKRGSTSCGRWPRWRRCWGRLGCRRRRSRRSRGITT